ncbi:MAG: response regulator transcription factor [Cytophagaceae bacterium]|nr:response regulator transcription factor [Cytophagaceae bacterium]
MIHILLVEDDPALGFVVRDSLEHEGYTVDLQPDGRLAWAAFETKTYDLCLLDVMLPYLDGFTLGERIRASGSDVPIVFLTAKSLKEDRLKGFRLGGDDYLTKPFSIEELVLRIEVIRRRIQGKSSKNQPIPVGVYTFGPRNLKLNGPTSTTDLTQREADLLALLLRHCNEVVPRDQILVQLWGKADYFLGRSLDVFVSRLRKYLSADPSLRIVNVHGVGFRLEILTTPKEG